MVDSGHSSWTTVQGQTRRSDKDFNSASNSTTSWTVLEGFDPHDIYEMRLAVWRDAGSSRGTWSEAMTSTSGSRGVASAVRVPVSVGPVQIVVLTTSINAVHDLAEGMSRDLCG